MKHMISLTTWDDWPTCSKWFRMSVRVGNNVVGCQYRVAEELLAAHSFVKADTIQRMLQEISKLTGLPVEQFQIDEFTSYRERAASEFEGVEDLDPSLWIGSEGLI